MKMMSKTNVKVKKLHADAIIPEYQTDGSAGFDLHSVARVNVLPGCTSVVPTGLAMAIPAGYELQIRSRSGLAAKHDIAVLNAPGTIDSDYRGEVKVILRNHGSISLLIEKGDRICQGVLKTVPQAEFEVVDELDDTDRGSGGFGSTGK